MSLANFLSKKLEESGKSMSAYAKDLEISPMELSRVLNKTSKKALPSQRILEAISAKLNIDVEELKRIAYEEETETLNYLPMDLKIDNSTIEILSYPQVHSRFSWSSEEVVKFLMKHDEAERQLEDDDVGSPDIWGELIVNYPESNRICIDSEKGEVIGDWSLICLTEEQKASIERTGSIRDKDCTLQNTASLLSPGMKDLYILNFSYVNPYNSARNMSFLFKSFLIQILNWAIDKIFVQSIYIKCRLPRDQKYFEDMGFKKLEKEGTELFKIEMENLLKFDWVYQKRLEELYECIAV